MSKFKRFGLRPLLCVVAASVFVLHMGACNSAAKKPEQPANNDPAKVTDTSDKTTPSSPDASTPEPETPAEEVTAIAAPNFSAEGGFYSTGFTLTLSGEPGHTVYYTTDGSDPCSSDSATKYTTGIKIYDNTNEPNVYSAITDITLSGYQPPQFNVDKGITVRAVSKSPEGNYSDIATNSYFVGKTATYYSDLKIISMVTDSDYLFHQDTGAYMIGSKYYEWKKSDDYVPYDAGDVLNVTNYNTSGRETEFPVSIQVFEDGKAVYSTNVGARISGNWSRAHAQKSFRLYARKEYGDGKMRYAFFDDLTNVNGELIEKFDKVTIRNGGNDYQELHFRDALFHDLTKDLAFDVMEAEPCILFVNGEFWGFYMIREKTDGDYIEAHYGIAKEDVAIIKNSDIEEGSEEDLEEFRNFCLWAASADMADEANYKKFCDSMDVQSLMDYVTVETYLNNNDWANGGSNNWMVWHSKSVNPELPKADGKWRFILYDTEFSTGLYGSEQTQYKYDLLNLMSAGKEDFNIPNIVRNVSKNDTFRQAFYDNYLHIIETCFDPDTVCAKTDLYVSAYSEATKATFFRFGLDWAAWNYEGEVEQFKNYFVRRPKYAKQYLNTFCGVEMDDAASFSENQIPETVSWTYYGDATFRSDSKDNAFHASIPQALGHSWEIQSQAGEFEIVQGGEYCLTFEASSTDSATPKVLFNRQDGWNWPECWVAEVPLTSELKSYEFRFVMTGNTADNWRFCINFGKCTGDLVFKNVSFTRIK